MRSTAVVLALGVTALAAGAEVESRVLTHYVPQDLLEAAVRKEGWTEVPLAVKGGVRKGDVVRIWAGGSIDRGNGDQPGENAAGPDGVAAGKPAPANRLRKLPGDEARQPAGAGVSPQPALALSADPGQAFALLFKPEGAGPTKCLPPGKPLEIKLTRDKERLYVGFNDERGRYHDNHLGRGRRHELDPLWVRIEVVRIIVD
jgi:hypothetical protein